MGEERLRSPKPRAPELHSGLPAQLPPRRPIPAAARSSRPCQLPRALPPARVGLTQPGPPRPASSREEPPTARRLRREGLPDYRLADRVTIERRGKSGSPSLSEEAETVPEVEGRGKGGAVSRAHGGLVARARPDNAASE